MPCIAYTNKRFRKSSLKIIEDANKIISDYMGQGFPSPTLRQLYYRFIALDLFPESWIHLEYNLKKGLDPNTKNTEKNYGRLGDLISEARLAGLIDWNVIEDRHRHLESRSHWDSPAEIIEAVANQYHRDLWANQPYRPVVFIEKDALVGVFEGICEELDVPYLACKGYVSQSMMWRSAQRMIGYERDGQTPIVFHFGDHDPSGLDMTRDMQDRLVMFGCSAEVKRLALNMDQIKQYNPPPNPAKVTDSRFEAYSDLYGDESWELDALEPAVMIDLARTNIEAMIDRDAWDETTDRLETEKGQLQAVSDKWDRIVRKL